MLSYFCSKCGGKNIYQFQKPKFCSHCGSNFSITSSIDSTNIKSNKFEVNINTNKKTNQNINIENDDFEQPIQDYSSMRGLDVNIQKYNQNDGVKLRDLVSDEPKQKKINANKKNIKQRRVKKKIAKSLPEIFVSEAKMTGRNYQDGTQINDIEE